MNKRKSRIHLIMMGVKDDDYYMPTAKVFKDMKKARAYATNYLKRSNGFKKKSYELYKIEHVKTETKRYTGWERGVGLGKGKNAEKKQ